MIFQIALGVAGGVVVAVLVLRYWSGIWRALLVVVGTAVLVGALLFEETHSRGHRASEEPQVRAPDHDVIYACEDDTGHKYFANSGP
jgi:hypothetical protein